MYSWKRILWPTTGDSPFKISEQVGLKPAIYVSRKIMNVARKIIDVARKIINVAC